MLDRKEKTQLRSIIFRHLDGLVTVPSAYILFEKGITSYILKKEYVTLETLAKQFTANAGYLNVALRVLASQGWLHQEMDNDGQETTYRITENGKKAFELFPLYKDANTILKLSEKYHPRKFEVEPFRILEKAIENYKSKYEYSDPGDPVFQQILRHIEGVLLGPSIVLLAMNGMFHKYFMETSFRPEEFHRHPECFESLLNFFTHCGWFEKKNGTFTFTDTGLFFARRATAYGVTVSYIPTLRNLDKLVFGDPHYLWSMATPEMEAHVDREMNVWGSGGAHSAYFDEVDRILIEVFNKNIEDQPKGLLDMGCGNGAFLIHAFHVIEQRTIRGKMLEDYPLFLVGADYNSEALRISRENIIQADIWAKFVQADIGDPLGLSTTLKRDYDMELSDLLSFRSFIDHNRLWQPPKERKFLGQSCSTGAFAYRGEKLNNRDVESSLYDHLKRWKPFIHRHGLLVIELHCLDPLLTAAHMGKTPATAYEATHGYSDQYIVEIDRFREIAHHAGLHSEERFFRKFPDSETATVSVWFMT